MAELKTKPNAASVTDFLDSVDDPQKRADSYAILELMQEICYKIMKKVFKNELDITKFKLFSSFSSPVGGGLF